MPPNKKTTKEHMECIYSHKHNCNCYKISEEFDKKFNGKLHYVTTEDGIEFTEVPMNKQVKKFISDQMIEYRKSILSEIIDLIEDHDFQLYKATECLMMGNTKLSIVSEKDNLIDIFDLHEFLKTIN
jgi:hypothetical protein